MAFDTLDCHVHLLAVDLDGGPYARDVRVARLWDGAGWRWADDWSTLDGKLLRPGHAALPVAAWPERLEFDAQGRLTARVRDGRRLEVLRDAAGGFLGLRAGTVQVRLTENGAEASDGRTVTYTLAGTLIEEVKGPLGTTTYGYAGAALDSVRWPDGGSLRLEGDGTSGLGGRWRCALSGDSARIDGPAGRWEVTRGEEWVVTTPGGTSFRSRWADGLLTGWTDGDGVRVELERDASGRIEGVRRDGERVARLTWDTHGLVELRDADGTWKLSRDEDGSVVQRLEPDGRGPLRDGSEGRPRWLRLGSESTVVTRDAAGRPSRLQSGGQGEARVERDAAGNLTRVTDGAGSVWSVERGLGGAPQALIDPAARRWDLRTDADGRLSRLVGPDGGAFSLVHSNGRLAQLSEGASRWTWLRDGNGALSGLRDPEGRQTTLSRSPSGAVTTVRLPDGITHSLGRDGLGRLRSVDGWRIVRDGRGRVAEVRGPGAVLAGWSRDGAGRVTGFGMGDVSFEFSRDLGGRVASVRAGETDTERWRLSRDSAGRVSEVSAADGSLVRLARDSAGLVTRVTDAFGEMALSRDMRGRVTKVVASHTWSIGRDLAGRVVRVQVDGLGTVGADYEADGGLRLLRLPDAAMVRRNVSRDAGELIATDHDGQSVGTAGWTRDGTGRILSLDSGGRVELERDPAGRLVRSLGPDGEWTREAGVLRAPDGSSVRTTPEGVPTGVSLATAGPWGLGAGEASYRWEGGRLTGLDGEAGGAALVHDSLGRPTQLHVGGRTVAIERDALGRLRRVGGEVVQSWDALLAIGRAPRVSLARGVVARPGGVVLSDPRGHPLLAPWSPPLRPWPTGWTPGVAAAETGAGGRFVLPGGLLLGFLRAVDPLSGVSTTPDRWPWVPLEPELGPAPTTFPTPDAATPALWDPVPFDTVAGWSDPVARLVEGGWLPGGGQEPAEAPGLPWLPASFARTVPAVVAGHGAVQLDEDIAGQLVLGAALFGRPLDHDVILDAFVGPGLRAEALDVPGIDLPVPAFVGAALADAPYGR